MRKMKKLVVLAFCLTMLATSTLGVSAASLKDLFDAKYYADSYEDLKAAFGYDEKLLYEHYLTYGLKEGRNASAYFDVRIYRELYADLQNAFGDDWTKYVEHYLTYGLKEGRDGGGEMDMVSYAKRYPDLYKAFGYDFTALLNHYQTYGKNEERNPLSEVIIKWQEEEEAARRAEEEKAREEASRPSEPSEPSNPSTPSEPSEPSNPSEPGDSSGRTEEAYDEDGYHYIYTYDEEDKHVKTEVYDPAEVWYGTIVYTYDDEDNLAEEVWTYYDEEVYTYEYDKEGRLIRDTTDMPADGYTEENTYEYAEEGYHAKTVSIRIWHEEEGDVTEIHTYEYDQNGLAVRYRKHYPDAESYEIQDKIYEYEYDENEKLVLYRESSYTVDGLDSVWCKEYYDYENGILKQETSARELNGVWYENVEKYDEQGQLVYHEHYYPAERGGVECWKDYYENGEFIKRTIDGRLRTEQVGNTRYDYYADGRLYLETKYGDDGEFIERYTYFYNDPFYDEYGDYHPGRATKCWTTITGFMGDPVPVPYQPPIYS